MSEENELSGAHPDVPDTDEIHSAGPGDRPRNATCKWCGELTGDWYNECQRCTCLRLEIKDNPTLVDKILQNYQDHDPRENDPNRVYPDEGC